MKLSAIIYKDICSKADASRDQEFSGEDGQTSQTIFTHFFPLDSLFDVSRDSLLLCKESDFLIS